MPKSVFTDAYQNVTAVLVTARHDAGLHQSQLAAKIGKDQSFISNIERGHRRVDILEFYAIAKAMKCDPVELFAAIVERLPNKVAI